MPGSNQKGPWARGLAFLAIGGFKWAGICPGPPKGAKGREWGNLRDRACGAHRHRRHREGKWAPTESRCARNQRNCRNLRKWWFWVISGGKYAQICESGLFQPKITIAKFVKVTLVRFGIWKTAAQLCANCPKFRKSPFKIQRNCCFRYYGDRLCCCCGSAE